MSRVARFTLAGVLLLGCSPDVALESGGAPAPTSAPTAPPTGAPIGEDPMPTVIEVVCTKDGETRLPAMTTVAARADGVHVRVDNRTGETTSIGAVGDASAGTSTLVASAPPGHVNVACYPGSWHDDQDPPRPVRITVVDPAGHWVSGELECPEGGMASSQVNDYAAESRGDDTDPVIQARREAGPELRDADFVRAGYPDARYRTVAARLEGRTVAVYGFSGAYRGDRWLLGSISACEL